MNPSSKNKSDKSNNKKEPSIKSELKSKKLSSVSEINKEEIETYLVFENTIITYSLLSPRELSQIEYNVIKKDKTTDMLYEKALKYIDADIGLIMKTLKPKKNYSVILTTDH